MVRYLAFQGQSSDERSRSYARDGLPLVRGLTELSPGGRVLVRERGRWVPGVSWTPPGATPPSPGWVSEESAFAYAADRILTTFGHRSFDGTAAALGRAGVEQGIETPADAAAGRRLGAEVGARVLARALVVLR
jgi:hypothetical protein